MIGGVLREGFAAGAAGRRRRPEAFRRVRAAGRRLGVRRRAAARRRRPRAGRPRPVVGEGGAAAASLMAAPVRVVAGSSPRLQQEIAASGESSPVIAFIFPGQGSQAVGMGKALADAFDVCRETFAEADEALGEPLSRLCFEGPEDQLRLTENTQPAILTVSVAAYRLLASRGFEPAFVAGHSLGEYSAHVAAGTIGVRRRGAHRPPPRPLHAGGGAGRGRVRWRRSSGSTPRRWRRRARRRPQGEVVSPANLNMPGPGGHRRRDGDAVARARRAREGAGRQARRAAAGERPVPLRADEARRGAAGARPARAAASRLRACRWSPTWTREPKRDAAVGHRGAGAAGVVAGPLGGRDAAACIRRRPQVC